MNLDTMTSLPETIYSADSDVRHLRQLLRQTLSSLWSARPLAWRLTVRDLRARYRESFLGVFWALGPSLVTVLTFSLLQRQQILNVQTGSIPYPVYVMFGTILWELFTGGLTTTLSEIRGAFGTLSKVNLPREAFLLSAIYKLLFDTSLKCIPLVILLLVYRVPLALTFPLVLLPALAMLGLGLFLALLLMPLTLLVQDVARLLTALLAFGLFVTPVLYPMPTEGLLSIIASLNPVTPFLNSARLVFFGPVEGIPYTATSDAAALFFGLLLIPLIFGGLVLYRLAMPIIIERLSD